MARSVQLSDSIASRFCFQPCAVVRADHADPGRVARALSGALTSTSHAAPSTKGRRFLRSRTKRLESDSGDWSRKGSVGPVLTDDAKNATSSLTGKSYWKGGRHRSTICCRSSYEAPPSQETIVTPRTLWQRLKPTINYLSGAQLCMVNDALQLAFRAHDGQKRRSGEPFIIHPVEVANILGELEMDWETIVAGLLHDTVEDTEHVTFEGIEQQFGSVVRRIVEGETKVSKLGRMHCQHSESKSRDVKADDLRQMFLAMTEEVRVIIVKLADRLHNMRTLSHMPPHKQLHIAQETLQVFAPLAKVLGMYRIKSELEDLSFLYSNADEYRSIKQRVAALCKEQDEVLLEGRKVLLETIEKDQFLGYMTLDVQVRIHYKELYSLYKKMLETKCSVDEIRDIAQLRVILKLKPGASVGQMCAAQQVCYHVLGLVHAMWPPVPGTVKDYIATPKPNGYQSLHTTVIPFGSTTYFPLEIQLRTEEMDKLAEWGIAAHHSGRGVLGYDPDIVEAYSGKNILATTGPARRGWSNMLNDAELGRRVSWLNSIREWQEEFVGNMTSREFVDAITGDLLGSRVFVFTPRGEIKNLPKGATVVDYAYQIHTDVGNKMVAAKVNGNIVSPTHTLINAEVVEVLTYDGASQKKLFELHRQWLQFARTRSARHKLTKFLKEQATLSAEELTAESVKNFVGELSESDLEDQDDESGGRLASELFEDSNNQVPAEATNGSLMTAFLLPASSALMRHGMEPAAIVAVNGIAVNGKPMALVDEVLRRSDTKSTNGTAGTFSSTARSPLAIEEETTVKFEAWQSAKVAMWHGSGGRSLQWLSVCCIDRKCMLAEVTFVLGASGILICGCAAETDQHRGLGIMIFHVEGDQASLVRACSKVGSIGGVLNWATGCTWQNPQTARHYL